MKIDLTIKNYRCFLEPATVRISKGFTSFVGVNNAGKSTLMRFLLELRQVFEIIDKKNPSFIKALIDKVVIQPKYISDPQEIFSNLNNEDIEFWFDFILEQGDPKPPIFLTRASFQLNRNLELSIKIFKNKINFTENNPDSIHFVHDNILLNSVSQDQIDLTNLYTLFRSLKKSLYIGPFRNIINVGTNADYLDIQIGQSFIQQYRALKTGSDKRSNGAMIKLTESIKQIFGFNQLEINPSDDDKALQIIVNGQPYRHHELGSGLQQFILVLVNALVKKPSYILIDEPELNLHPGLQLNFLTTLGLYASEGVWFSTHSIGLARSSSELVYSIHKKREGESFLKLFENIPSLAQFLGEMSFSAYKELGFEKILLVEGSTEVKVIQQFLRKMSKEHKVMLLPLSGRINGGIASELEEIKRITSDISVVIDSEKTSAEANLDSQRKGFVSLCKKFNISCHVLEYRATENYLTDKAVKVALGDSFHALSPYESLKDVQPKWNKNQNWKIAREIPLEDLMKTDLGKFLSNI